MTTSLRIRMGAALALGAAGPVARYLVDADLPWAVLVALAGTSAAGIALGAFGSPGTGSSVPVWPALGLILGAQLAWFHGRPAYLVVGLLVVAGLGARRLQRRPELARRVDAAVERVVTGAVTVILGIVIGIVALPLLYLPAAVARLARSARSGHRGGWQPAPSEVLWERRPGSAPFLRPAPSVRRRRHALSLVTVLLLSTGIFWYRSSQAVEVRQVVALPSTQVGDGTQGGSPDPAPPSTGDGGGEPVPAIVDLRFSDLPAFEGVEFADELQAEQREVTAQLAEDPTLGVVLGDFEGRYTSIVGGRRVTPEPECVGCPVFRVWVTGGSVAFGLGQRDDRTIAAELVRLGAQDGLALEVTNLGVPGRTLEQELEAVRAELDVAPAPDLVISVGGYNDALGALVAAAVNGGPTPGPNVMRASDVQTYLTRDLGVEDGGGEEAVADAAVIAYRATSDRFSRMVSAAGASTLYYFHPDALAHPVQLEPVIGIYPSIDPLEVGQIGRVLARTARSLDPPAQDLRDLYRDLRSSVFVDWAHTNERGARLVAERIYPDVAEVLDGTS